MQDWDDDTELQEALGNRDGAKYSTPNAVPHDPGTMFWHDCSTATIGFSFMNEKLGGAMQFGRPGVNNTLDAVLDFLYRCEACRYGMDASGAGAALTREHFQKRYAMWTGEALLQHFAAGSGDAPALPEIKGPDPRPRP